MKLSDTDSKIVLEWDYDKNELTPDDISPMSHKEVFWKCTNGHLWSAIIANRYRRNDSCPYCSGKLPIVGKTDLFSTNPELISVWDYQKNGEKDPTRYKAGSDEEVCSENELRKRLGI